MLGDPSAVASTEGVTGDAVVESEVVGAQVTVCVAREVVKLILDEVADAYVVPAPIVAVKVQVPAETKATKPVDELTVQTPAVELV